MRVAAGSRAGAEDGARPVMRHQPVEQVLKTSLDEWLCRSHVETQRQGQGLTDHASSVRRSSRR
eukprot:352171-Chlamydomonas_euryale.AAC.5